MRVTLMTGLVFGTALVAVACGEDETERTEWQQSALTGDGTIPRVANPPASADLSNLPGDLRAAPVPVADVSAFVKDNTALVQLGKALFWDAAVGSDGVTACASCHFRAGTDPRSRHQLNPGPKGPVVPAGFSFNLQLSAGFFPITRLAVPPGSPGAMFGQRGTLDAATDRSDVVGSAGAFWLPTSEQQTSDDPLGWDDGRAKFRRVTPRNTPSVINAVFNHRQFWDGRAENTFNGVNHAGTRDPNARVYRADTRRAVPIPVAIAIANASLASQAVAPVGSQFEQAFEGQGVRDVGRRLREKKILEKQAIHPQDSVLGVIRRGASEGADNVYYHGKAGGSELSLVERAFKNEWWDSTRRVRVMPDGTMSFVTSDNTNGGAKMYSLLEYNFGLFFGLAIQAYEATLVSDDTPWDRFRRQHASPADPALNPWTNTAPDHISRLALFGAHLFNDRTRGATNIRCSNCHESAELTDASARRVSAAPNGTVRNRDGNVIDKGFNNIGVRPTADDLGNGASDEFGVISAARRRFSDISPTGQTFDGAVVSKGFGVEGAFKIPSLRNVALTGPYFHNGDVATLREAVALYSRGGNVAPLTQLDGTPIEPLGVPTLSADEVDAIVAFLEALTDDRVVRQKAPFDHPALAVANGHDLSGQNNSAYADRFYRLPAVGAAGGTPIPGFLETPFR